MLVRCAAALTILLGLATAASAAEKPHCLAQGERLVAFKSNKFVPLARVMRQVKARHDGQILRVRLCKQGPRYLYVLTVLPRNGKVVQASVDASSGADAGGS
jgi:uncharacterized membrane protein YkoI